MLTICNFTVFLVLLTFIQNEQLRKKFRLIHLSGFMHKSRLWLSQLWVLHIILGPWKLKTDTETNNEV